MKYLNFFPLIVGKERFNIPQKVIDKWINFIESTPLNILSGGNDAETQDQDLLDNPIQLQNTSLISTKSLPQQVELVKKH